MIRLPAPTYESKTDLNKALQERRSVREYRNDPLLLAHVSQLLWAAQGVTSLGGYRTTPSAGALYPLEVYVVAGNVTGLPAGIYKYSAQQHALEKMADGDRRQALGAAALEQGWLAKAPAVMAISAVYPRTTGKYGERGARYVHMEVGHAGQNVALEAVSLGLGTCIVAAMSDSDVKRVLGLPAEENPLYLIPVGRK
jgi:SagB-type dehydrogenase family enzyme